MAHAYNGAATRLREQGCGIDAALEALFNSQYCRDGALLREQGVIFLYSPLDSQLCIDARGVSARAARDQQEMVANLFCGVANTTSRSATALAMLRAAALVNPWTA